jgi:FkbM family methyltransferase
VTKPYISVETQHGPMFVLSGDTVIGRSLRFYGEFSGDEISSITQLVDPGSLALDVGANIGVHTLALARAVGPTGHVLSLEPQRHCHQVLCANVVTNGLTNVDCMRAAAGRSSGVCNIPDMPPQTRMNFGATTIATDSATPQSVEVPLVALDDLKLPSLPCSFVKVDAEGYEIEVLGGADRMIRTHWPTLYVEAHSRENLHDMIALVSQYPGYAIYAHHTAFFRKNNYNLEPVEIFKANAGGTALLAVPVRKGFDVRKLSGRVSALSPVAKTAPDTP